MLTFLGALPPLMVLILGMALGIGVCAVVQYLRDAAARAREAALRGRIHAVNLGRRLLIGVGVLGGGLTLLAIAFTATHD